MKFGHRPLHISKMPPRTPKKHPYSCCTRKFDPEKCGRVNCQLGLGLFSLYFIHVFVSLLFSVVKGNLQWNGRWNVVDMNIFEIPRNPEIPDNHFWKSGNPGQICTKSRNPARFVLGFPKSWKSRTLFWVVKCPSLSWTASKLKIYLRQTYHISDFIVFQSFLMEFISFTTI